MRSAALLRRFIAEAVGAGPAYARMEAVRQRLQDILEAEVRRGAIGDPAGLADWWDGVEADVRLLRGAQPEFLRSNPEAVAAGVGSRGLGEMIHDAALEAETPGDLTSLWGGLDMSIRALRGVPLEVWRKKLRGAG